MAPYDPLAMRLYRSRKATIDRRISAGEMTRAQGAAQLRAFALDLFRRRGDPRPVEPDPDPTT